MNLEELVSMDFILLVSMDFILLEKIMGFHTIYIIIYIYIYIYRICLYITIDNNYLGFIRNACLPLQPKKNKVRRKLTISLALFSATMKALLNNNRPQSQTFSLFPQHLAYPCPDLAYLVR